MTVLRSNLRTATALVLLAYTTVSFGACPCPAGVPAVTQHDAGPSCLAPDAPPHDHEPACEHALQTESHPDEPAAVASQSPRPDPKQAAHAAPPGQVRTSLVQALLPCSPGTGPPRGDPTTLVALEILLLI